MNRKKKSLLIVEDDPGLQAQLRWCFEDQYEVVTAGDRKSAIAQLRRFEPDVVTVDLGLPPRPADSDEGFETVQEILSLAPATKVIVVTGNDDRESAVTSVGLGAYDFYQKPVDPEILGLIVARAFIVRELEEENRILLRGAHGSPLDGIIAGSPGMLKVCRTIERLAPTDVTAMLLGESGTGKEVLVRSLHSLSHRSSGPFVAINCAAIPENLLESELFGYEKGAFTGAARQNLGKIEYANGGTLVLDEIGDLPGSLQAKLLRFLQERVIERVGGRKEIPVDVRVVCATHRDLRQLIAEGTFREDLFYRITEITVEIPPLRERVGDAVLLGRVLLERFARDLGRSFRGFSKDALEAMERYEWPGNVRELENRIKRAAVMADGNQITAADLELSADVDRLPFNLREVRETAEREAIARAISHSNSNLSKAAEILGITRPTLYSLLSKHGLKA